MPEAPAQDCIGVCACEAARSQGDAQLAGRARRRGEGPQGEEIERTEPAGELAGGESNGEIGDDPIATADAGLDQLAGELQRELVGGAASPGSEGSTARSRPPCLAADGSLASLCETNSKTRPGKNRRSRLR